MKWTKWIAFEKRTGSWIGAVLAGSLLTACSHTPPTQEESPEASGLQFASETLSQEMLASAEQSQRVFEVLAAEVLVAKGYPADAFKVLLPLAAKTRDAGLAQRAFELSMATYDENAIGEAATLWTQLSPEEPSAWRVAYFMSLRQNRLQEAIAQWQTYRRYSEASFEEDVVLAAQRLTRTAPNEAISGFFDYLQRSAPDVWQVYYGLGLMASNWQQPEVAVQKLERAVSLLNTAAARDAAVAETKADSTQQIYQLLSKVYLQLPQPQTGLKGLKTYLQRFPDDWLVQERMARLEVKAEQYAAAEKRYELILKANEEATTSRLSLALLQIELQKYAAAEAQLMQVVQQPAYESVGYYYLGILSQQQNRVQAAYDYFEKVKVAPYALDARLHQSEIVFAKQGLEAAVGLLDSVSAADDASRVKLYRAKAIFYRASGRFAEAIALFDKALAIEPDNAALLFAQAGLLYEEKRFAEYEAAIKKVLTLQPNDVEALNALGYFYAEQNIKLDEAAALLQQALSLAHDNHYVLDSVGWLAFRQQRYDDAETYLQRALAIQLDAEIMMHLIVVKWVRGERAGAEALWHKYRQTFADEPRYAALLTQLKAGVTP